MFHPLSPQHPSIKINSRVISILKLYEALTFEWVEKVRQVTRVMLLWKIIKIYYKKQDLGGEARERIQINISKKNALSQGRSATILQTII